MLYVFSLLGALAPPEQEFFLMFSAVDENLSWYLDENIQKFCKENCKANDLKEDEQFIESNQLHCKLFLFLV